MYGVFSIDQSFKLVAATIFAVLSPIPVFISGFMHAFHHSSQMGIDRSDSTLEFALTMS